jgi:hypothetical protein
VGVREKKGRHGKRVATTVSENDKKRNLQPIEYLLSIAKLTANKGRED